MADSRQGDYLAALDLLLGLCTFPEAVLEFSCHVLHVTHAASAGCASAFGLQCPVELAHLLAGVSARRAGRLLNVERNLATSSARGVRLIVSFSE